ncbi:AmmeMemoRadiSam system protein B [Roseibium sp. SCP14]|uniref:AmmeMemoRadiSam system protein B n=1 Tax=Roseibium sp. SCP14 TaxID=3141375 RepID=UPI00333CFFF6
MKLVSFVFAALLSSITVMSVCIAEDRQTYPAFYLDDATFKEAIAAEESLAPYQERLTGLIVPHHLLVAPLIARGFKLASGHSYKRAVLLFPDHFRQSRSVFSTSTRAYETVLGSVDIDIPVVEELLKLDGFVEPSDLFDEEHAIRALLPFLKHYLPETQIVPIAVATAATREDADRLATEIEKWIDDETIIIQSTDFSHFHQFAEARKFDQQTLNVLAAGDLDQIAELRLPDHVDSVIAFYLNARLQSQLGAQVHVVSSKNSNDFAQTYLKETTSYITAVYGDFSKEVGHPVPDDVEVLYLAGDFTLGRNVLKLAQHPASAIAVKDRILEVTKHEPLIVNLEGVVLPNVPRALRETSLAMPEKLAHEWLTELNIKGASLANNHSGDFGELGMELTKDSLERAGVHSLENLTLTEFDNLTVFAATDLKSTGSQQKDLLSENDLENLFKYEGSNPIIAFLHWGEEYVSSPSAREYELVDELRQRGVTLVVGAHPHVRSNGLVSFAGGETLLIYSLGNFLFDQSSRISSGAVAEIRIFPQGTYFVRLIDIPNYYETGIEAAQFDDAAKE